jgi:hypothetical protein
MDDLNKLEEISWERIRDDLYAVNPDFSEIIDNIDPSFTKAKKCGFFLGTYTYGQELLLKGRFQIPSASGKFIPLNSPEVDPTLQERLGYNFGTNPVSVVLSGSAEIFMVMDNHTVPLYGLINPGKPISTWKILSESPSTSPAFLWDMTTGARSAFMPVNISNSASFSKITREFDLEIKKPKGILDQWHLYKGLANHSSFGEKWTTKILYFSKEWFDHLDDPAFLKFKLYLYKTAWEGSNFYRNQFIWNLAFSLIQRDFHIKEPSYIEKNVNHLLAMGIGALPGYSPAIDDSGGPFRRISDIIASRYGWHYSPSIIQPHHFSLLDPLNRPVYFSLHYPNTLEFPLKSREDSSKLADLVKMKSLLTTYVDNLAREDLHIDETQFFGLADKVQYDFYHTEVMRYSGVKNSKDIWREDRYFNIKEEDPVYFNGAFWRGCIRIKKKE